MNIIDIKSELTRDSLKHLKGLISSCGYKLDYGKCLDIDEIFKNKINELLSYNDNDLKEILEINSQNKINNVNTVIVMYYFALYNDTVDILKDLVKEKFKFKNIYGQYELFSLDKDFISHFDKHEFFHLIKKDTREFSNYYKKCYLSYKTNIDGERKTYLIGRLKIINDIIFLNDEVKLDLKEELLKEAKVISLELKSSYINEYNLETRDELTKKFAYIMVTKPNICKRNNLEDDIFHNIVIPDTIMQFGSDVLLNLSYRQKEILNNCFVDKDLECASRLRKILKKYPKYNNRLPLSREVLDNFTDEELNKMSENEVDMYKKAINIHELARVKKLYLEGVTFGIGNVLMTNDLFNALSDEEIINLSPRDKIRIEELYSIRKKIKSSNYGYNLKNEIRKIVNKESIFEMVKKIIS